MHSTHTSYRFITESFMSSNLFCPSVLRKPARRTMCLVTVPPISSPEVHPHFSSETFTPPHSGRTTVHAWVHPHASYGPGRAAPTRGPGSEPIHSPPVPPNTARGIPRTRNGGPSNRRTPAKTDGRTYFSAAAAAVGQRRAGREHPGRAGPGPVRAGPDQSSKAGGGKKAAYFCSKMKTCRPAPACAPPPTGGGWE